MFYEKNDLTELKNLSLPAPTSWEGVTFLKGRTDPGDRGAGIFSWNPGSTAGDDNATIISSSSGGSGRWVRQVDVRGPVHAEWFGAKGNDPNHDDRPGIQSCLDTFGRVDLLAKTYTIQDSIKLKATDRIQGAGIDKTVIKNVKSGTGLATVTAIENNTSAPTGAVVRDLTIDCNFSASNANASRQAILLTAADVLIERVKAINYGAGTSASQSPCMVITAKVATAGDRLGTIKECVLTQPGNNSALSYPSAVPPIYGYAIGNLESGTVLGVGGSVCCNRVVDVEFTGTSGAQRSILRGIAFGRCRGTKISENEIIRFDGMGVFSEVGTDEDVIIENNRFIDTNIGICLGASTGVTHTCTRAKILGNIILLGKKTTASTLYGVWCQFSYSTTSVATDCWIQRNFVRGTTISGVIPIGVRIQELSTSNASRYHVEDNILELPDAVSGGFNTPYENALAYSPSSPVKVDVHANRSAAGFDLRLKLISGTSNFWGSCSTRVEHYKCPVFDGRAALAVDDFLGQGTGFSLGWTPSTSYGTSIASQNGEAGHPGVVKLDAGSSTSASVMLSCGSNGFLLGGVAAHVVEFAARRSAPATVDDNYECRLGFLRGTDEGVYFKIRYDTNNNNIIMPFSKNGTNASSISSALLDNGSTPPWRTYRIEVLPNPSATVAVEARFFVDGAYLGSIKNQTGQPVYIPDSGTPLSFGLKNDLIAGSSTTKALFVDYFQYQIES